MRNAHDSTDLLEEDSLMDALYRAYGPTIFAFLRQHTATRSDAEDLLLDVFVMAPEYEGLAELAANRQLAWLWRVVRNKAIDHYRRNARRPASGRGSTTPCVAASADAAAPGRAALALRR